MNINDLIEEVVAFYYLYRRSNEQITALEDALTRVKSKHMLNDGMVDVLREAAMDVIYPEE